MYLKLVGLLGAFQSSNSVQNSVMSFQKIISQKSRQKAISLCSGDDPCTPKGVETGTVGVNDIVSIDVTNVDCLFSVGNSKLNRSASCKVVANCPSKSYTYSCSQVFWAVDEFVDALDIKDQIPGNQDLPQGKPFMIYADWKSNVSGAGGF